MQPLAIDLLKRLLEVNPTTRITIKDVLKHSYFDEIRNESKFVRFEQVHDLIKENTSMLECY